MELELTTRINMSIQFCSTPECDKSIIPHRHCEEGDCAYIFEPVLVHHRDCPMHRTNIEATRRNPIAWRHDSWGSAVMDMDECFCDGRIDTLYEYHVHCGECELTTFHIHCDACDMTDVHAHCRHCDWIATVGVVDSREHCQLVPDCAHPHTPHTHCEQCGDPVEPNAFHKHCLQCDVTDRAHKHCNICAAVNAAGVYHEHCPHPGCVETATKHTHCNYPGCAQIIRVGEFHKHCSTAPGCNRIDDDRYRRHRHCKTPACGAVIESGVFHRHCKAHGCARADMHRHCKHPNCNVIFDAEVAMHKHCRKCNAVKQDGHVCV